jgi:hypothetical protein
MKRELGKLEGGDGKAGPSLQNSGGFENLRRFRDVKFLERLTELLTQQFEAAKIDEAKDISIVQVLDKAIEPERKTSPKRALITILTALAAAFLAVIWAFIREASEKAKGNPRQARQFELLRRYVREK